jgi:hypothetical protein
MNQVFCLVVVFLNFGEMELPLSCDLNVRVVPYLLSYCNLGFSYAAELQTSTISFVVQNCKC